jgi:hypothetical protein
MIMVAAAIHKYTKNEYAGTETLLTKGIKYMKDFIDADVNIDRQDFLNNVISFKNKFDASRVIPESEFPKIKPV